MAGSYIYMTVNVQSSGAIKKLLKSLRRRVWTIALGGASGVSRSRAREPSVTWAPAPWSFCWIYAEDAEHDFMPFPGKIEGLRLPEGLGVRNDCGVYEEAEVPIYYDPMIAKLITWGENRVEAILRMRRALREYQVRGIKTNISFHQWILRHPRFMAGNFSTGFIDEEYHSMSKEELYPHKEIALDSAAIAALHRQQA